MGFGDLNSSTGQRSLNEYLADRSYIEGFQPSQADAIVFTAMKAMPPADLVNALRWYNHIKSYGAYKTSFPGVAKPLDSYGPAGSAAAPSKADDDDDMDDLFGSSSEEEEEDEAAAEERKRRLEAYAAKKANKPTLIAKSNIILDVKPWDDETDMKEVERLVKTIECDGLLWGTSKLVEVGYGIKKLVISCVVQDDKVGTDFLEEEITKFEDHVQSVDIAAFNKI